MAAAAAAPAAAARAARVGLLYDERMCAHATPDGEEHPENPERLRAIWRKLAAEGVVSRCVVLEAKEAKDEYIAPIHSQDHIKLMKNISSKGYNPRRNKIARKFNSIYFNKGSSQSAFLAAGSVIEVSEKVAAGELSSAIALVRPPGHHAEHDEAMGFCLFNNVAIAASYLLNERPDLGMNKILIVDWDVHHGNATQKMFYSDPRVLFFSVHRFDNGTFYPAQDDASHCFIGEGAGKGYNINVPWEHEKIGDADYIAAWDHVLLPVAEAFGPDIVLVSAGFDAALDDPLGGCCITPNGYSLLLTKLLGLAQGRIMMALEGGYNLQSTANSVFSCIKVLLGDKFAYNSPEMQPFESTWRVIQAVRDELKTCWPVLGSKLSEYASPRSKPSQINVLCSNVSWDPEVGHLCKGVAPETLLHGLQDNLLQGVVWLKMLALRSGEVSAEQRRRFQDLETLREEEARAHSQVLLERDTARTELGTSRERIIELESRVLELEQQLSSSPTEVGQLREINEKISAESNTLRNAHIRLQKVFKGTQAETLEVARRAHQELAKLGTVKVPEAPPSAPEKALSSLRDGLLVLPKGIQSFGTKSAAGGVLAYSMMLESMGCQHWKSTLQGDKGPSKYPEDYPSGMLPQEHHLTIKDFMKRFWLPRGRAFSDAFLAVARRDSAIKRKSFGGQGSSGAGDAPSSKDDPKGKGQA